MYNKDDLILPPQQSFFQRKHDQRFSPQAAKKIKIFNISNYTTLSSEIDINHLRISHFSVSHLNICLFTTSLKKHR